MGTLRSFIIALFFSLLMFATSTALAADICSKLTEDEVSAAVGTPLKRSPTDPCRFGHGLKSVYITMHAGGGSQFDCYAATSRQQFPDTQTVAGIGSKAIFFGFNLAVQYKHDLFVVNMMLGKSIPEKISLSKAVALKVISHL